MKVKEKVLITDITSAIESIIKPAWEQPRSVIKAVEKSARKLAHKLIRTEKQDRKQLRKARSKKV